MPLLITGLCLWATVHFVPGLSPGTKEKLVAAVGPGAYRGLFALFILTALGLIIAGWRAAVPVYVYQPPYISRYLTMALMAVALYLLVSFPFRSNIKRIVRHPQLAAVAVWAAAHLIANGDTRALALFGGLGLWAILEMIIINRRQGPWTPPESVPVWRDFAVGAGTAVVYLLLIFGHPYFTGLSVL